MAQEAQVQSADRKSTFRATLALCVIVFISGGSLMGIEIAGSRVLAPSFGTSIFVWGSLIGLFMTSLALGYYLGGMLSDWKPSFGVLASVLSLAGLSVLIVPHIGYELCDAISEANMGLRKGSLAASAALFFLPCLLMGIVSPFAVKLQATSLAHLGNVAGKLYALSTAGSIVGTFVTSFYLIPAFNVLNVLQAFGIVLIATAIASLLLFRSAIGGVDRATGAAAGVMFLCLSICAAFWAFAPEVPQVRKGSRVLEYRDSAYHQILVGEQVLEVGGADNGAEKPRRDMARELLFNRNLESGIYPYREKYTNSVTYTDVLHLATVWVPSPKKVLVVGGGGGVVPMQFREHYPGCVVDVFEIDDEVKRVALEHFNVREDDFLHFLVGDGRHLVRRSNDKYDIVILDAYSSGGQIPFHLLTKEFLGEVKERIAPGGVLVTNVISAIAGDKGQIYRAEYKTLLDGGLFRQAYTFPKLPAGCRIYDHAYWTSGMINVIVIATDEEKPRSKEEIVKLAEERSSGEKPIVKIERKAFLHHAENMLEGAMSPAEQQRHLADVPVLTDRHSSVDTMYRKD